MGNYVTAAVEAAVSLHQDDLPGDILIFLTGDAVSLPARVCTHGMREQPDSAQPGCLTCRCGPDCHSLVGLICLLYVNSGLLSQGAMGQVAACC